VEILVTIMHADGTAGVVRDNGRPWLTGDVSRGPSTGLRGTRAGMEGLRDGSLHGGMLPRGASGARVRDGAGNTHTPAVGGGAWVLVLPVAPDAGVAVCFVDADGALVRPELPGRYVREPVEDSEEPCPACGGTEWELVTPDDPRHGSSSSGDGPEIASQFLYCVACGHEEGMGGWFSFGADVEDADPEELARWQAEWEEQQRGEHQRLLASVRFPLYAPEGMAVELGGWSGSDGRPPSEVTLFHEGLTVASAPGHGEWRSLEQQAARELTHLMGDPLEEWPERSDAGRTLWLRAREREQARAAAKAEHGSRDLLVDGIAVPFAVAHAGDRWVAAGMVGKVQLTVTARDVPIEAVRLRALADPTRLDGGFVPLRAQRDPLDPIRVIDLAQGTPLEDIAGELAALARPGLRLVAVDGPAAVGTSKLGGRPDLPAGSTWPLGAGDDGQDPLTFFGQLALADLDPAVWPGPRSGLLSVFLAFEVEYYGIDRSGAAHLVHTPAGTPLIPLAFPAALPAELHLPEEPVHAMAQLTLPGVSVEPAMPLEPFGFSYGEPRADETDTLHELTALLADERDRRPERARMLGWPTLVQGDTLLGLAGLGVGHEHARAAYVDWALLLQTEIDGVGIYVGLPIADLATGRFDRAEATAEHT
jgi:hypothetical protein